MNVFGKISNKALSSPQVRSALISFGGKVFHTLYGNHSSLGRLGVSFVKKSGIEIQKPEGLLDDIEEFKKSKNGIIIANHASGIFSDYLAIFSLLGDDILRKCIFYTGEYSLAMNEREFPGYQFRGVPNGRKTGLAEGFRKRLQEDLMQIGNEGGYIFLIPAGAGKDAGGEFGSLFTRIIEGSSGETPVLSFYSQPPNEIKSYSGIIGQRWTQSPVEMKICDRLTHVGDWRDKNPRGFYNAIHSIKNPS